MWTTRNIALLVAGGVAIATVAYLSGRRETAARPTDDRPIPTTLAAGSAKTAAPDAAVFAAAVGDAGSLGEAGSAINSPADLFTKLQNERDTRPKLEPTSDSVFAALKKMGVEVDEQLQVAGFVVGARFCDKIRTKKDVHVVVCEYPDEAAAIKGLELGASKNIKGRDVLRNKATTIAVHQTDEGKQSAAEAAKIRERVKTL